MGEIIKLRDSVEWRHVEAEILALDTSSSTFFNSNRAGALLWSALSKGRTREQLAGDLVAKYGIDSHTAQRDVNTFLAALRKHGLLD
ncbi:MAG TPA: PqqD family protein [Gemmatimonadaceae bacterium]|nr:PqqD family protein [Gemmatimonadaceae bacterium]